MVEENRKHTWTRNRWWLVAVPVFILIAIAAAILLRISSRQGVPAQRGETVVGEIEGQVFFRESFEEEVRLSKVKYTLQDQAEREVNRPELLNRIIGDILLIHSAAEADVQVENDEVQDEIDAILRRFGITKDEMVRVLSEHKLDWKTFEASVREYLILTHFLDDFLLIDVPLSERETYPEEWMAERYLGAEIFFEPDFLDEVNG